jgi:hypothetical protein
MILYICMCVCICREELPRKERVRVSKGTMGKESESNRESNRALGRAQLSESERAVWG